MRTYPVISLFLISTLVGCLDAGTDNPAEDVETPADVASQAACLVPPTPPPADIGWSLLPGEDKTFQVTSYGTGACSRITFAFGPATEISGSVVGNITSQAACENTTVTGRFYQRVGSTWTFLGSKADSGTWSLFGCAEPEIRYEVPGTGPDHGQAAVAEMRLYLSASRQTCTTTTPQLCGTTYGLPVESTGGRHEHF
ncbi:MAG: hypothetical protein H7138_05385 [Myxococcales bacterium]|nr:hypothetical protein [Myxococcales bacterium]